MGTNKIIISLLFLATFLVSCSAPKKSAYHPRPKSNTYKKPAPRPQKPTSESENIKLSSRNADGYMKADELSENKKLTTIVNDWLGVPHRIGGKDKSGIDCSGFTTVVMRNVYKKEFVGSSSDMSNKCKEIRKNDLHEGDLVFFKINGPKVSHVGVYLSNGYFAHATLKKGVLISSLSEPYYDKYYSGSGRVL